MTQQDDEQAREEMTTASMQRANHLMALFSACITGNEYTIGEVALASGKIFVQALAGAPTLAEAEAAMQKDWMPMMQTWLHSSFAEQTIGNPQGSA